MSRAFHNIDVVDGAVNDHPGFIHVSKIRDAAGVRLHWMVGWKSISYPRARCFHLLTSRNYAEIDNLGSVISQQNPPFEHRTYIGIGAVDPGNNGSSAVRKSETDRP